VLYYRVRVTQNDSSNVVSIRTLPAAEQPLASAVALQIVPNAAAQQVELRWRDLSENETGFEIERSLDGVNFTVIETVAQDVISFVDEGLDPANYYYRVRSVRNGEYSDFSEVVRTTLVDNLPEAAAANAAAVDTSAAGASSPALAGSINVIAILLVGLLAFLAGMGVILVIVKKQKPTSDN
jgi:hypothetical protein